MKNLRQSTMDVLPAKQVGVQRLAMERRNCKVCVTGGTGYLGSLLVKKLLEKGYTVHATTRNLSDTSKVNVLRSLPYADTRLVLFQAEIYNPDEFDHAIKGCETVFHVATPKRHIENSQFNNTTEAALASAKSIATSCIQSGTVKRLIYTAAFGAACPVKIDGSGFKDFVDETCWTPPNLSFPFADDILKDYTNSKTLVEKEILSYDGQLGVVTLPCGLLGGETILNCAPGSIWVYISQLTDWREAYNALKFVEDFLGIIPVVHVDDACEAHIFCMENPSIHGRFFCASGYVSSADIANYFQKNYPEYQLKQGYLDGPNREVSWDFTKLIKKGFEYKYGTKTILDECIRCARRMGALPQ